MIKDYYDVCVVDVGSPKQGNLGWCLIRHDGQEEITGDNLDDLVSNISKGISTKGLLLGLEACLFVPIRKEVLRLTAGRKGEGNRPWSAGAGAQVLAINLPIMTYIFSEIYQKQPKVNFVLSEDDFTGSPFQIFIFEAFVSGQDKGISHIEDAQIMSRSCNAYAANKILPPSILQEEERTQYLNLAACSLLHAGIRSNINYLHYPSPIYRP